MKKLKGILTEVNKINEWYEVDTCHSTGEDEYSQEIKESLIDILQPSKRCETLTEHRILEFSHTTHKEPLMKFERFIQEKSHN